jgi:hypothetical protein
MPGEKMLKARYATAEELKAYQGTIEQELFSDGLQANFVLPGDGSEVVDLVVENERLKARVAELEMQLGQAK